MLINHQDEAEMLMLRIMETFDSYIANFDLEDCDKILRIQSPDGMIQPSLLIEMLNHLVLMQVS